MKKKQISNYHNSNLNRNSWRTLMEQQVFVVATQ